MAFSPFVRLFQSLARTRNVVSDIVGRLSAHDISAGDLEELESLFLGADMGVRTTMEILQWIASRGSSEDLRADLAVYLQGLLSVRKEERSPEASRQEAIFIVGVNGTGKTTTAAKLAHHLKKRGAAVLLIGADTYRAAGAKQLMKWCEIAGVRMIFNESAGDPSSVVFDGLKAALSRGCDFAVIDTAGRLHTDRNLMKEVEKMHAVATSRFPRIRAVTYVTLDANLGQNSLSQAREFNRHIPLDGIILTKMDGTAKGGIVFPIYCELAIPVKYVGIGETLDDLVAFCPKEYVSSLLGTGEARA